MTKVLYHLSGAAWPVLSHRCVGERFPWRPAKVWPYPFCGGRPPQRPGWHAESTERTLPASGEAGQGARVLAPALHSCSARRARRRLAQQPGEQRPALFRSCRGHDRPDAPARTPPRRPVAARVRFCGAASGAPAWGSAPGALRIGFRPASSTAAPPCSVQPVPREAAPPFAPPVSPTGRGSGACSSCA